MKTNSFVPSYAAFGVAWSFDLFKRQIYVLIAESEISQSRFPFGFPGGKEAEQDNHDLIRTVEREFKEETCLPIALPESTPNFFIKSRRNDFTGTGEPFRNHFMGFKVEDKDEFQPRPAMKDTVKEVRWRSLQEAELLPLKNDHRLALIEFCYKLDELIQDDRRDALSALTFKMFHRPDDVAQTIKVRPEQAASVEAIMPAGILPKEAFSHVYVK